MMKHERRFWTELMARVRPDRETLAAIDRELDAVGAEPVDPVRVRRHIEAALASQSAPSPSRRRRRIVTVVGVLLLAVLPALAFGAQRDLWPEAKRANSLQRMVFSEHVGLLQRTGGRPRARMAGLVNVQLRVVSGIKALQRLAVQADGPQIGTANATIAERARHHLDHLLAIHDGRAVPAAMPTEGDWSALAAAAADPTAELSVRRERLDELAAVVQTGVRTLRMFDPNCTGPCEDEEDRIAVATIAETQRLALEQIQTQLSDRR